MDTRQQDEILEALRAARAVIDELLPGAAKLACDIGLINDGCIKLNRAIAAIEEGSS